MNLRPIALAVILFPTSLSVFAQTLPPSGEHKQWADVTHKFETAPLDEDVNHDAALAVAEIASSHDFHVAVCQSFYNDFNESQYQHHTQVRLLYLLGAATYQVETGKMDGEGTNLYALHSVLKGYAAILREDAQAKDKKLDEFARLDAAGKLPELIEKKHCK